MLLLLASFLYVVGCLNGNCVNGRSSMEIMKCGGRLLPETERDCRFSFEIIWSGESVKQGLDRCAACESRIEVFIFGSCLGKAILQILYLRNYVIKTKRGLKKLCDSFNIEM